MISKKHLIILILKILESNTDPNHTLTQIEISKMISKVYSCDRKTVGRNIQFLQKIGYPIVKTSKGFFMDNKVFTIDEVNYLICAIESAEIDINIDKSALMDKTKAELSKLIKRKNN